jgi:multidrug efflux pump subunit AcrB
MVAKAAVLTSAAVSLVLLPVLAPSFLSTPISLRGAAKFEHLVYTGRAPPK